MKAGLRKNKATGKAGKKAEPKGTVPAGTMDDGCIIEETLWEERVYCCDDECCCPD